jgi:hypothetical protein
VFNGAISWIDMISYNEASYDCNNAADLLLTDIPRSGFYATPEQDLIVNVPNNSVTTGFMYFESSTGAVFSKAITNANRITACTVGINNVGTLTTVSGSGSLSDAEWYDFYYANSVGVQKSVKYRVNVDRRCKIEDYEVLFLDRKGSLMSYAFQLRSYEKGNITKQTYNKDVTGYSSSNRWQYNSTEFGKAVANVLLDKNIELNTNYMSGEMATYFEQLLTSPLAFLKIGSTYQAIEITDNSFENEKAINKHLIRKKIIVKASNQNVING